MASKGTFDMGPVLVLVVALLLSPRAMAQSGCTNVLISMAPCLNYVTGSSATPSSTCCASLANVVRSQPRCLCTALDGGGSALGVNINRTLALAMPTACNVQTPPVSRCNGPPEAAPGGSSDETPDSQNDPSVSGSKTVPSNDSTPNIGITIEIPLQLLTLFLFMASYASAFSSF